MSPPLAASAIPVHSIIEGPADAPVVILSHSLGASIDMWRPQAAVLARHLRVVRYDLRGHGLSPVPPGDYSIADLGADIVALLDRRGIARAHLCGLSLGAMVSLWVAAHFPERVSRLVVCCTSARLGPPAFWAERAALVRAQGTSAIADAVIGRWFTAPWLAANASNAARAAELRATIAATSAQGYAGCCAAIEHMDLRPDLGAIRAATLAIAGADDPSTPPTQLEAIAAAIPRSRVQIVAAAHLANVEQPERVTELILEHLQTEEEP